VTATYQDDDNSEPGPFGEGWTEQRTAVLEGARAMHRLGLVSATNGNVSARCHLVNTKQDTKQDGKGLLAITATSRDYESMELDDVVVVDFDGEPIVGDAIPSTETLMHAAIYRARPDVGAVMHTHSVYATALAVAGTPLPPIADEMVIYLGRSVEVTEYRYAGTEELGDTVVATLGESNAAIIRNHGLVGVGRTVEDALRACTLTERLAQVYILARGLGSAELLPAEAVETELELFRMRRDAEGPA
jgi:L-fuculose-phosphate aldolase